MPLKVYLARSRRSPEKVVDRVKTYLLSLGVEIVEHEGGSANQFNENLLRDVSALFMIPDPALGEGSDHMDMGKGLILTAYYYLRFHANDNALLQNVFILPTNSVQKYAAGNSTGHELMEQFRVLSNTHCEKFFEVIDRTNYVNWGIVHLARHTVRWPTIRTEISKLTNGPTQFPASGGKFLSRPINVDPNATAYDIVGQYNAIKVEEAILHDAKYTTVLVKDLALKYHTSNRWMKSYLRKNKITINNGVITNLLNPNKAVRLGSSASVQVLWLAGNNVHQIAQSERITSERVIEILRSCGMLKGPKHRKLLLLHKTL